MYSRRRKGRIEVTARERESFFLLRGQYVVLLSHKGACMPAFIAFPFASNSVTFYKLGQMWLDSCHRMAFHNRQNLHILSLGHKACNNILHRYLK